MKRQASQPPDSECPTKQIKEAPQIVALESPNSVMETETSKIPPADLVKSPASRRERKAPAWLASYVTDGSIAVKESPKGSSLNRKKTIKSQQTVPEAKEEDSAEVASSLQKKSTFKLEGSPPHLSPNKNLQKGKMSTAALARQDIDILNLSASDSGDSSSESVKKKSAFRKQSSKVFSLSSSASSSPKISPSKNKPSTKPSSKMPSKRILAAKSSIHMYDVDANDFSNSNVVEVCDTKSVSVTDFNKKLDMSTTNTQAASLMVGEDQEKPKMLEIVICISTSGAMRDYLTVLQDKTREMIWRLQSLIPSLRIGVFAHTQGGIHDDKPGSGSSAIDHNYIRTGGHSGTKWLDLGASFSQICAFVDSLEPEVTVYPDYVQDNLEMALWKLQRCMSWSACSYRTVVMLGRGRPNRTSFYLQREHWRGWIRSALEIGPKMEIPIIDWELEAKLLAQMGIHVCTIQVVSVSAAQDEDEDEGTMFFRRVAEITNSLHIKVTETSKLIDIMVGVCCACHGPDLLQAHRDTLRDENDGVLPQQLKDVFIVLQLHSKCRSLSTIPTLEGDLTVLQQQLKNAEANGNVSSSGEETSGDEEEQIPDVPEVKSEVVVETSNIISDSKVKRVKKTPIKLQNTVTEAKSAKKANIVKNKPLENKGAIKKAATVKYIKVEEKTEAKLAAANETREPKEKNNSEFKAVKKEKAKGARSGRVGKAKAKVVQAKIIKAKAVAKLVPPRSTTRVQAKLASSEKSNEMKEISNAKLVPPRSTTRVQAKLASSEKLDGVKEISDATSQIDSNTQQKTRRPSLSVEANKKTATRSSGSIRMQQTPGRLETKSKKNGPQVARNIKKPSARTIGQAGQSGSRAVIVKDKLNNNLQTAKHSGGKINNKTQVKGMKKVGRPSKRRVGPGRLSTATKPVGQIKK